MSLALEDDSTTLDEEDFGATADDEDTGTADEEDFGATADEEDSGTTADEEETRTTDEEDSFTLQHAVSGGSSLDEETSSTEDELSFPDVSGEVDEESSPQAASIAAKDKAIQPAKNFFMKTSYLPLKYKLKSPA